MPFQAFNQFKSLSKKAVHFVERRGRFPVSPAASMPPKHRALTDALDLPFVSQSEEDKARQSLWNRGQFLARQDRWDELSQEVRWLDQNRQTTEAGHAAADLLLQGAREDIVAPVRDALAKQKDIPLTLSLSGLAQLEDTLAEQSNDYAVSLVLIHAMIDIAWAYRGEGWSTEVSEARWASFQNLMQRAEAQLDRFCPFEMGSPALAAARCALLAARDRPLARLQDDYEDLIDLDPKNAAHMRAMGNHLLPRWYGSYQQLEVCARRVASQTADVWGSAGYAWVYLDALSVDPRAVGLVDPALFQEALRDILHRQDDPHTANTLAAFCGITLRRAEFAKLGLKDEADALAVNLEWILSHHLSEAHPLIWAQATQECKTDRALPNLETLLRNGQTAALDCVSQVFAPALSKGQAVSFGQGGVVIAKAHS